VLPDGLQWPDDVADGVLMAREQGDGLAMAAARVWDGVRGDALVDELDPKVAPP